MILVKSSHVSGSYPVSGLGIGSGLLCGGKKVTFGERKDLLRLPSAAGGRSGDSTSGHPLPLCGGPEEPRPGLLLPVGGGLWDILFAFSVLPLSPQISCIGM